MINPVPSNAPLVGSPTVSPSTQRLESPTQPVSEAGGAATPAAIVPQVVRVQVATDMLKFANEQPAQTLGALVNVQA